MNNYGNSDLGVVSKYFSGEGYEQQSYALLKAGLSLQSDFFLTSCSSQGLPEIRDFETWYQKTESQEVLVSLIKELQILTKLAFRQLEELQRKTGQQHMPVAHDEWQMAKDVAEAVRLTSMDELEGPDILFAIPTAFHDWGRIIEAWFFHKENPCTNWIPHAQLSYAALKDVLDQNKYEFIPEGIKKLFLHAVLVHSYSENGASPVSRRLQACDRMQLYGGEGDLRAKSFLLCLKGASSLRYPDEYRAGLPAVPSIRTPIAVFEGCTRALPENTGEGHKIWQRRNLIESIALLRAYQDGTDEEKHYTDPKLIVTCGGKKILHRFDENDLLQAGEVYEGWLNRNDSSPVKKHLNLAEILIGEFERQAGAAKITDQNKHHITLATNDLTGEEVNRIGKATQFAIALRQAQDGVDIEYLGAAVISGSPVLKALAEPALDLYRRTYPA